MTSTLEKPTPPSPDAVSHGVPVEAIDVDRAPQSQSSAEATSRLAGMTTQRAFALVSIVFAGFVAIVLVGFLFTTSWLRSASDDNASLSVVEDFDELVTGHLMSIFFSPPGSPDSAADQEASSELEREARLILESVSSRSDGERFAEPAEDLLAAISHLDSSASALMGRLMMGEELSEDETNQLGFAFVRYSSAAAKFADALQGAKAESLATQSNRADLALIGLVGLTILAGSATLFLWRIGLQAARREESLQEQVLAEKDLMRTIVDSLPESIAWKDSDSRLVGLNREARDGLIANGLSADIGSRFSDDVDDPDLARYMAEIEELESEVVRSGEAVLNRQVHRHRSEGYEQVVLRSAVPLTSSGRVVGVVSTGQDITETVQLEKSLAQASKLESIGQLAAGVAHEINTPVQYVSDNASFLETSCGDLFTAMNKLIECAQEHNPELAADVAKSADLDFLIEEIPDAITQSQEGLQQIARIVRAMKDFAHPGTEAGPGDVNKLIKSTVDVSRNEWKYDAEIELDLEDEMPEPHCNEGQLKQVFLNMIVNAAHAIADSEREKGTIAVSTRSDDHDVHITIADNGAGMTDEVKARMFDRFFTTKEVGRGSGQGLAIAHEAITSHGGSISCESEVGVGTTFKITIPIEPVSKES